MRHVSTSMKSLLMVIPLLAGCGAAVQAPTQRVAVSNQIVTQAQDTTEPELFRRAERELLDGQFAEARRDFELLLKAGASAKILPSVLLDLGTACEALGDRQAAQSAYHTLATKFPALPTARTALVRCLAIHAVLEQWAELAQTGDALLARTDIDSLDRMAGLGARGLSNAELGDTKLAMKDVGPGVELMENLGIDRTGRLPSSAALLELALGEAKRIETERIQLMPVGNDFVMRVSNRCQGLLDAQAAYAQAMRTNDLQWGMMAGYRLAAMYETLHRELMTIPADGFAKNETQRQLFYGIMHVRYRALLEKALIMLSTTLDAADLVGGAPTNPAVQAGILPEWLRRGREEKARMEADLAEEKATLAKFPFTEQDLENTLATLQKRYDKPH